MPRAAVPARAPPSPTPDRRPSPRIHRASDCLGCRTSTPSTQSPKSSARAGRGNAAHLAATAAADIVATFNTDLDPPRNVLNRPFYYGYSGVSKPLRSIDFVSVAMHEITHGLGFLGLVNVDREQRRHRRTPHHHVRHCIR